MAYLLPRVGANEGGNVQAAAVQTQPSENAVLPGASSGLQDVAQGKEESRDDCHPKLEEMAADRLCGKTTGEWHVELPAVEVDAETLVELCHQHQAASVAVRRLAKDLEGLASDDAGHGETLQLWMDQKALREQLETVLAQAKAVKAGEPPDLIGIPSREEGAMGSTDVSLTSDVPTDTFLHTILLGSHRNRYGRRKTSSTSGCGQGGRLPWTGTATLNARKHSPLSSASQVP